MDLRLHTLGEVAARDHRGVIVPGWVGRRKRLALLVFLAVDRHRPCSRDRLLATFWPKSDERGARNALRQALHVIRQLSPDVLDTSDRCAVGINAAVLWCDVVAFEAAVRARDHAAAMELYGGAFLEDFHLDDARDFEDWADLVRLKLRRTAVKCCCQLAAEALDQNSPGTALMWIDRASCQSPYDERLHRALLLAYRRLGDRSGAEAAHRRFAQRLWADMSWAPSSETESLLRTFNIQSLKTRTQGRWPAHRHPAGSRSPSSPRDDPVRCELDWLLNAM